MYSYDDLLILENNKIYKTGAALLGHAPRMEDRGSPKRTVRRTVGKSMHNEMEVNISS